MLQLQNSQSEIPDGSSISSRRERNAQVDQSHCNFGDQDLRAEVVPGENPVTPEPHQLFEETPGRDQNPDPNDSIQQQADMPSFRNEDDEEELNDRDNN